MFRKLLSSVLLLGAASASQAFYTVLDTSDIMKVDSNRVQLGLQAIGNDTPYSRDGVNVQGRYSTALNEDTELQFEAGTGKVDFNAGAFGKYRFTTEEDTWASFSLRGGYSYTNVDKTSVSSLQFQPIASKKVESTVGVFTPYVSLPINVAMYRDNTTLPVQLVVGSEFRHEDMKDIRFLVEYSGNAVKSFNSINGAVSYDF